MTSTFCHIIVGWDKILDEKKSSLVILNISIEFDTGITYSLGFMNLFEGSGYLP
jgi:hypothetical protein